MGSLTPEFLREALDYYPLTGALVWRVRPRYHFATEVGWKKFNTQYSGNVTRRIDGKGHVQVKIRTPDMLVHTIGAHRAIWAIVHGKFSDLLIDHINGDRQDNRLENLREATYSENAQNRKGAHSTSKTGVLGVVWSAKLGMFRAYVCVGGVRKFVGSFRTIEEASDAYQSTKLALQKRAKNAA